MDIIFFFLSFLQKYIIAALSYKLLKSYCDIFKGDADMAGVRVNCSPFQH
ncbi:hypothetical protein ES319_D03G184700v1 [Gossypium barbadense]|uniref:Uncharacterized protein n=2 Tax=Gossypium TaxID=3633 RepID=A0A5J5S8Y5_GOSBA|nr:hypothetical protein ES319_D03G184700v1 [Gossypium barbadense]TYG77467.1 hypothetical protein ES288_D03G197100v1 [Gossypium darwinii]